MEPKYRKLPKKSTSVQSKILPYPNAVAFLKLAGFSFAGPEHIECSNYNPELLNQCADAIQDFIKQLGAQVENPNKFDPYAASVSSTTGNPALPGTTKGNVAKF